jgi:hypothetical protein
MTRRRTIAAVVLLVAAVAIGLYSLFAWWSGRVTADSLSQSLIGHTSADSANCQDLTDAQWACTASDDSGNTASYRLRIKGHCWSADRLHGRLEVTSPSHIQACISASDQL